MHEYDIALKAILTRPTASILARLTGLNIVRWHNSELPEVRTRRADLLGETSDGTLVHIELQSTNDPRMALRMLEYSVAIHRAFGRFPEQVVLYVGELPLRMEGHLSGRSLSFACRIVDIRELEGDPLLTSPSLEDNIISVLTRLSDEIGAVRKILDRIAASDESLRPGAVAELLILAGLRSLEEVVEEEIERMPILNDIMDHKVIGRKIRKAMADGEVKGRIEGEVKGRVEGERAVILGQIGKRFGSVPAWVSQRLESLSAPELEQLALRLFDAAALEELFD